MRTILTCISSIVSFVTLTAGAQDIPSYISPLYRRDTVTIRFLGDIMMHARQIEMAHKGDGTFDFSSYFSIIGERIESADIAVANMEFTLGGKPYSGYPIFSAPDAYGEYLAECGFDIFLTANNHIFDRGADGAERTLKLYRELERQYDIKICGLAEDEHVRAGNMPLKQLVKGMRIAFINFTYGTNLGSSRHWPKTNYMKDNALITDALRRSEDCDVTIALPHWGTEYELIHSPSQEATAIMLAENGADIIVGTHPHVPQDTGTVTERNVPVIYSLGNAVSNMSAPNTQLELMAELKIVREENGDVRIMPVQFTYLWCSRPGGYTSSYTVIPVKEYIGRRSEWKGTWDYDKMVATYDRVQKTIGIKEN